eukprot:3864623-Pleurochrysis_carterae.AAC.2
MDLRVLHGAESEKRQAYTPGARTSRVKHTPVARAPLYADVVSARRDTDSMVCMPSSCTCNVAAEGYTQMRATMHDRALSKHATGASFSPVSRGALTRRARTRRRLLAWADPLCSRSSRSLCRYDALCTAARDAHQATLSTPRGLPFPLPFFHAVLLQSLHTMSLRASAKSGQFVRNVQSNSALCPSFGTSCP